MRSFLLMFSLIFILLSCDISKNKSSDKELKINFSGKSINSPRNEYLSIVQSATKDVYLKLWSANFSFHYLGNIKETSSGFIFVPEKNLVIEKCKNSNKNYLSVNINDENCFQRLTPRLLINNSDTTININKPNQFWNFPNENKLDVSLNSDSIKEFKFNKMSINLATSMLCISCDSYLDKLEIELTSVGLIIKNFYKGKPLSFKKHDAPIPEE